MLDCLLAATRRNNSIPINTAGKLAGTIVRVVASEVEDEVITGVPMTIRIESVPKKPVARRPVVQKVRIVRRIRVVRRRTALSNNNSLKRPHKKNATTPRAANVNRHAPVAAAVDVVADAAVSDRCWTGRL